MNRFKNEHLILELPKGYKPKDFMADLLRHFGVYLGGVFSLTPCENPSCCNPFHFKLTANKTARGKRHLHNQYQDLREISEDIDWNLLREIGICEYLKFYNSSSLLVENPYLQISRTELIQAILLKSLDTPEPLRESFWSGFTIISDKKLIKALEKEIYENDSGKFDLLEGESSQFE